jgi:hypothetical protein
MMMETWYRTQSYGRLIEPVQVVKSTKDFITLQDPRGGNRYCRTAINGTITNYHRSYSAARSFVIGMAEGRVITQRQRLADAMHALDIARTLPEVEA